MYVWVLTASSSALGVTSHYEDLLLAGGGSDRWQDTSVSDVRRWTNIFASQGERLEIGKMLSAQDEVVGVDLRLPKEPIYLQSREWKIRPLCFCTGEEFIKSHTELFLYNWQWHRCKVETGLYLSYLKWCIEHLSVYPTANSFCKNIRGSPGASLIVISYWSKISQATCCLQYPLF